MLKKKLGIITLLVVLILALTIPVVKAENETTDANNEDEEVMVINEDYEEEATTTTNNELEIKRSDVYLAEDNVTIDYAVDGNLFVFANSVTISSQIGGDVFVCAKSVTIEDSAYVFNNLFVVAENLDVNGVIYNLYSVAENINITGYVYKDIRVSSKSLNIPGVVGRDAFVSASKINFGTQESNSDNEQESTIASTGRIGGNFNYSSKNELEISDGIVSGEVNFNKIADNSSKTIGTIILSLITFITTVALVWLIGLWLLPKATKSCEKVLLNKPLPVIGLGILAPIVLMLAFVLGLVLNITSSFAFLLLALFFILIGISTSVFVIAMNNLICSKLKLEKMLPMFGMLIVSSAVLWLVGLIPYVGSLVSFVAVILGMGILVANIVLKNKNNLNEKTSN